jgi:hypothetical protein
LALLAISGFSNATANIQPAFARNTISDRKAASISVANIIWTTENDRVFAKNQLATTPLALFLSGGHCLHALCSGLRGLDGFSGFAKAIVSGARMSWRAYRSRASAKVQCQGSRQLQQ